MPFRLPIILSLLAILQTTACSGRTTADDARRPNFLLIVADDVTWRDFGFTGNRDVKTPNLDRLATEGMHFTTMFSPATTCSPSRHALYTGLYPIRSGAYPNHTRVYDGTRSLFTYLKQQGYRVALQGKEHVNPKASFPYERLAPQAIDNFEITREYINRQQDEPWLLVFASNDPHSPWNRGPKGLHDPAALSIPPYLHDNATTRQQLADYYGEINKLDWQVGQLIKLLEETGTADNTLVMFVSEQGSSFPYGGKWSVYDNGIRVSTIARWPGHIQPDSTTSAMVQYVDVAPTFLEAAGINPTTISTGCEDANGNSGFDGRSFLNVLTGQADSCRDLVYSQHTTVGINGYKEPYPMRAVRSSRYKYIRNLAPENTYSIGGIHQGEPITSWQADAKNNPALAARVDWLFHRPAEELYDLDADELETRNLAADPLFAEIRQELATDLDAWMKQQGDHGMETELAATSRQNAQRANQAAPARKPDAGRKKNQATATPPGEN